MTDVKRTKRAKPDSELVKLADSLLANYKKPEDLIGENGLLKQLAKMLVERALEVEMTDHLRHGKSGGVTNDAGNTRNGHSAKTLKGDFGALPLDIPRDRQGAFDSSVTHAVSEDVKLWQARPLYTIYPILYLDCIHVKVRDTGAVRNKAVYLAIDVNMEGHKEVLGLWIVQRCQGLCGSQK